jgi:hypothetical protein
MDRHGWLLSVITLAAAGGCNDLVADDFATQDAAAASTCEAGPPVSPALPDAEGKIDSDAASLADAEGGASDGSVLGEDDEDETIQPLCENGPAGFVPPFNVGAVRSVGASLSSGLGAFQVYGAGISNHTVGVRWTSGAQWGGWGCFGTVPYPDRVVGSNLSNGYVEVFATTRRGKVFVQRQFPNQNGPWLPFGLPASDSRATDVSVTVSREGLNHVYLVDRGRVFVRNKKSAAAYGPYGAWRDIGMAGGNVVSSAVRPDGRQQVFALDAERAPITSVQLSSDLGSGFESWTDFDRAGVPPLVDLESTRDNAGQLLVLAADSSGQLWTRSLGQNDEWLAWQPWNGSPAPMLITSLATARSDAQLGAPVLLAILTADGFIHVTQLVGGAWGAWDHLQ